MKAHLPKYLLAAILTLGMVQGTTLAAMTEPAIPSINAWTWNGTEWIDDATGIGGTPGNGAHLSFSSGSDYWDDVPANSGIVVKESAYVNANSSPECLETIHVEDNATALLPGTQWIKAPNSGTALWIDGDLVMNDFVGFSADGGGQNWHIGANGYIDIGSTSSIATNGKAWNIELVIAPEAEAEIEGVKNRVYAEKATQYTRCFIEGPDDNNFGEAVTSLTVRDEEGRTLAEGSDYTISNTRYGLEVTYKIDGYKRTTLTWAGDSNAIASTGTDCWVDSEGVQTTLLEDDNIVFDTIQNGVSSTVNVDSLGAKTIDVKGNYTFTVNENNQYGSSGWLIADEINIDDGKTMTISAGESYFKVDAVINGDVCLTDGLVSMSGESIINGNLTITGGEMDLYHWRTTPVISGDRLDIQNGTVTIHNASGCGAGSAISNKTIINIGTGGRLNLSQEEEQINVESAYAPTKIVLGSNDADAPASLYFWSFYGYGEKISATYAAATEMNGNSLIDSAGSIHILPQAGISVKGTNNSITANSLKIENGTWKIDVAENGELYIGAQIQDGESGSGNITKSGDGTLALGGYESTWQGTLSVEAGTLNLYDALAMNKATVSMAGGTKLEAISCTLGSLVLQDSSAIDTNSVITVENSLTLGSGIGLSDNTLQSILMLEGNTTVTLFDGVATLNLSGTSYTAGEAVMVDFAHHFTGEGLTTGRYYLGFNSAGDVFAGLMVPESGTATLSLLALAALAARRKRK